MDSDGDVQGLRDRMLDLHLNGALEIPVVELGRVHLYFQGRHRSWAFRPPTQQSRVIGGYFFHNHGLILGIAEQNNP